jgi:hypothetical protein
MLIRLRGILIASLALAAVACGDDRGTGEGTLVVAEEGGTVVAPTFELSIPAMALPTDTTISLETAQASDYPALEGSLPEVLRIEPEGTVLELPATIVIDSDFIGAETGDIVSVSQLVDGVWSPRESANVSGGVSVSVTVFAPIAVALRAIEIPTNGEIRGTVSWGEGTPAGGAPVQLLRGETLVTSTYADTTTGAFSFADLEPGTYTVLIDYECRLEQAVELTSGETENLELVLCGSS